jgi:hypothetical protein
MVEREVFLSALLALEEREIFSPDFSALIKKISLYFN